MLSAEPTHRRIDARYRDDVARVLGALREHERMSTAELTEAVGRSKPAVRNLLSKMRDAGMIAWHGKSARDPRAYWCLPGEH